MPWAIFVLLLLSVVMNGVFVVWGTVLWLKRPGIVDMVMYVREKGLLTKPDMEGLLDPIRI